MTKLLKIMGIEVETIETRDQTDFGLHVAELEKEYQEKQRAAEVALAALVAAKTVRGRLSRDQH